MEICSACGYANPVGFVACERCGTSRVAASEGKGVCEFCGTAFGTHAPSCQAYSEYPSAEVPKSRTRRPILVGGLYSLGVYLALLLLVGSIVTVICVRAFMANEIWETMLEDVNTDRMSSVDCAVLADFVEYSRAYCDRGVEESCADWEESSQAYYDFCR